VANVQYTWQCTQLGNFLEIFKTSALAETDLLVEVALTVIRSSVITEWFRDTTFCRDVSGNHQKPISSGGKGTR
jgi:hypothetical protein